ncbi:MAG TPA: type II toxin-antitoxin system RelE/ParE family toxin [Methylomusa anaerophila]|uniref:Plasmid stabilisation system protein n=1 Tax=Methylomusa anaerophila TaxID=1930071 RepID=A0A348AL35_9FIRM|nr:type II toxin-antitoxin system RelE/ParE family toxin [Methylomusa anaerophila]BBB91783.1 plasmid stabilisation system protein [Methylomusa anaerophila]HML88481.1 type II toxin-antitoxin system RelE/ParE family toxin [Methylomusa anaerophila]
MVKWSIPAKQDLKQIHDFIARDSDRYAKKVAMEIVDRSEALSHFPEMGRSIPELNDPSIREMVIYSYRLIYRVSLNEVEILALVHSRRELTVESLDDLKS